MPITPKQFLSGIDELISLPEVCLKVDELAQKPDTSAVEIAQAVAQDPHLAAQILRIANSPFYNFPMPVETLSRAIVVIGIQDLRDLVLSSSIIRTFSQTESKVFDLKDYWRHSVFTGFLARQLGAKTQTRVLCRDRLFMAGLLHDIGMLVMSVKIPEIMRIVVSRSQVARESYIQAEKLIFGLTHAEIGAELMKQWGLPVSLQTVARYHHSPGRADDHLLETSIVHIANAMSHYLKLSPVSSDYPAKVSSTAWKITGLNKEMAFSVLEATKEEFENSLSAFLPERKVANY